MRFALFAAAAAAALVAGCAETTEAPAAASDNRESTRYTPPDDPYPSTYRPYPGVPTAITGATIFDGEGGRIENGTVLLANGKVEAIGGPETPIPADIAVFDGTGKFLTPGVIDIHSHLGDYPSPGTQSHSDGNEATSPVRPEVWAEAIRCARPRPPAGQGWSPHCRHYGIGCRATDSRRGGCAHR